MIAIRRSPAAITDIDEIWLHIALDSPEAADRAVTRIAEAVSRLAEFPLSAPARPELSKDLRCLSVGAYRVFHRVDPDRVTIVRVIHAARDIGAAFDADA